MGTLLKSSSPWLVSPSISPLIPKDSVEKGREKKKRTEPSSTKYLIIIERLLFDLRHRD